ncbi:Zn-ribbon domain-containing OB-fold protein [Mycobacterium sp.]|uniref:Zn-ribbon domain-containing OB-fold protein n=1 Tax=Mycobacterium sp. TaxID=1785 RepID=UPI003BB068EE
MTISTDKQLPLWPAVDRDAASVQYFDAAARGELLMQQGPGGAVLGPEVRTCPETGSAELTKVAVSGRGALVTWVVVHHAPLPILAAAVPYVSGVVELDEGPWLMVRLVDVEGVELRAGLPVEVAFVRSGNADDDPLHEVLPVFTPSHP